MLSFTPSSAQLVTDIQYTLDLQELAHVGTSGDEEENNCSLRRLIWCNASCITPSTLFEKDALVSMRYFTEAEMVICDSLITGP